MSAVTARIDALSDVDALAAANIVSKRLMETASSIGANEVDLGSVESDEDAVALLTSVFPELSFAELSPESSTLESRGEGAKNLLVFLAENSGSTDLVSDAIDQALARPQQGKEFAPIPLMAAAAAIVFVLTINFEVTSTIVDGKRRIEWRVSRKASTPDQLKLIPGLGAPIDAVRGMLGKGKGAAASQSAPDPND